MQPSLTPWQNQTLSHTKYVSIHHRGLNLLPQHWPFHSKRLHLCLIKQFIISSTTIPLEFWFQIGKIIYQSWKLAIPSCYSSCEEPTKSCWRSKGYKGNHSLFSGTQRQHSISKYKFPTSRITIFLHWQWKAAQPHQFFESGCLRTMINHPKPWRNQTAVTQRSWICTQQNNSQTFKPVTREVCTCTAVVIGGYIS